MYISCGGIPVLRRQYIRSRLQSIGNCKSTAVLGYSRNPQHPYIQTLAGDFPTEADWRTKSPAGIALSHLASVSDAQTTVIISREGPLTHNGTTPPKRDTQTSRKAKELKVLRRIGKSKRERKNQK